MAIMKLGSSLSSLKKLAIIVLLGNITICNGLQQTPATSGEWRIALNIGREPLTRMPKTWASSGARMPLVIKCKFAGDGKVSSITGDVRFTGPKGEVRNSVEPGRWALTNNRELSFELTFPQIVERLDVVLDPGCTVCCEGLVFSTVDLKDIDQKFYVARSVTDDANEKVQDIKRRREAPRKWNFETDQWEQRYKDESIFSKSLKWTKLIGAEWIEARESRKRPENGAVSLESGPFPGFDCDVFLGREGKIKTKMGFGNTVIGTWTAEPINDNPVSYFKPSY